MDELTAIWSTASLVSLAELGDKSQLVCMLLVVRHGRTRTLLGAALAFSLLNGMAVAVGATLQQWVVEQVVLCVAAALFVVFAWLTWHAKPEELDGTIRVNHRAGAVLGIALLLALAELGDKTQLTVAVLSTVQPPAGTWLGATLGLLGTSAVAAWVGQGLVERVPMAWVKRVAALLFLLMGCWAGIQAMLSSGWCRG